MSICHHRKSDRAKKETLSLVPRARATSEDTTPEAEPEPDEAKESVPDGADPAGELSGPGDPSAHALLTQTAPDEESEAE